jgi:hypothetical protein
MNVSTQTPMRNPVGEHEEGERGVAGGDTEAAKTQKIEPVGCGL